MSFNLREEILKLSSTAPVYKEQDDESDVYDETNAKVESKSNEFNDDFEASADNRRIRPGVADLSEYGKRYKGKKVTRKTIEDFADSDDQEEGDEEEEEDDDEDDLEDDDDQEEDEDEEEEDEDDDEETKTKKTIKAKPTNEDESLKIFASDRTEEIEKGKVVRNQLQLWEMMLETRVKLQNVLNTVNKFPQHEQFDQIAQHLKPATEDTIKENKACLTKTFNQFAAIQQRLFKTDPDTHYMIAENNETKNQKRKHSNSDGESDKEEDDDEEIFSDTDEEFQANEKKRLKTELKTTEFKPLKAEQFDSYLEKVNKEFKKYRNATIQKWFDKTRLVTTKSFAAFEKPILQQVEHLLMDKDRLIKRTQLKRSLYEICGKPEPIIADPTNVDELKDRHLKDYDQEIFDDQDFYNQLMRELIDRQTSNVLDPVELSRKSIELQNLRNKNKKKVDTKASKGRKIRFNTHKPLVNFMAPIYRSQMSDEARGELFRSLFADHIKLLTSNEHENLKADNNDIDFNCLFKNITSK